MFPSSRQRYQEFVQPTAPSPVVSWKGHSRPPNEAYHRWCFGEKIPTTFRSSMHHQGSSTCRGGASNYHALSNSSWSLAHHEHLQGPLPNSFQPHHHPYTVIVGRGSAAKSNLGNKRLRILASNYLSLYATTPMRKVKTQVVNEIFNTIQHAGGTFVIQREDKQWYQASDTVAREKIGYILRDMLSDEYKSSSKSKMLAARRRREEGKHHRYFFVSSNEEQDPSDDSCHRPHRTSRVRFSMSTPDCNRSIFSLDQEEPDETYSRNEYDSWLQPSIVPPSSFPTRRMKEHGPPHHEFHEYNQPRSVGGNIKKEESITIPDTTSSTACPIPSSTWDSDNEEPLCFSFN